MEFEELERLLGIVVPAEQKQTYEDRLKSAVDHINAECGGRFTDSELPEGVKMGAALLVKGMGENPGVQSKTLADMTVSFFQGGARLSARSYWKPYIRARFF